MKILCKKAFNGDIVITDPSYFIDPSVPHRPRDEDLRKMYDVDNSLDIQDLRLRWDREAVSDWDACLYGEHLENIGFNEFLTFPTGYGPWSCLATISESSDIIGHFCSDSGLNSICYLREIIHYNSNYKDPFTSPWKALLIPKFRGTIYVVSETASVSIDSMIRVIGRGNLNFETKQVGY